MEHIHAMHLFIKVVCYIDFIFCYSLWIIENYWNICLSWKCYNANYQYWVPFQPLKDLNKNVLHKENIYLLWCEIW